MITLLFCSRNMINCSLHLYHWEPARYVTRVTSESRVFSRAACILRSTRAVLWMRVVHVCFQATVMYLTIYRIKVEVIVVLAVAVVVVVVPFSSYIESRYSSQELSVHFYCQQKKQFLYKSSSWHFRPVYFNEIST